MPEKGSASWQSAPFDAGLSLLRRPMRLCVFHCGKKSGLTVDLPRWSDGSLVVVCESNECSKTNIPMSEPKTVSTLNARATRVKRSNCKLEPSGFVIKKVHLIRMITHQNVFSNE